MSEIKKGSGPNGLPPAYFRILAYKTSDPTSSYIAWTDMKTGSYNLYIMVSDSNPFDMANLGSINKYSITYETPKWGFLLASIKWAALIILLALIL